MSNKLAVWVLMLGVGIAGIISSFAPMSLAQSESVAALDSHPAAI